MITRSLNSRHTRKIIPRTVRPSTQSESRILSSTRWRLYPSIYAPPTPPVLFHISSEPTTNNPAVIGKFFASICSNWIWVDYDVDAPLRMIYRRACWFALTSRRWGYFIEYSTALLWRMEVLHLTKNSWCVFDRVTARSMYFLWTSSELQTEGTGIRGGLRRG